MVDLSQKPAEQLSLIIRELEKARILIRKPKARIEIEKKHMGAKLKVILLGKLIDCSVKDVRQLLRSYGIRDATVKIHGRATLDDIEDSIFEGTTYRPAVVIANKADYPQAVEGIEQLKQQLAGENENVKMLVVSCAAKKGLENLGSEIFEMLDIIRVYTKDANKRAASVRPFTIRKDSTVFDLAKRIHTDFYNQFSYAKIWSKRLRFSPQKVGGSFTLEDGDTIEIHTR
jgi:ribosome-interacting GTPase 1